MDEALKAQSSLPPRTDPNKPLTNRFDDLEQRVESLEARLFSMAGADRFMSQDRRSELFAQAQRAIVVCIEFLLPRRLEIEETLKMAAILKEMKALDDLKFIQDQKARYNSLRKRLGNLVWGLIIAILGYCAKYLVTKYGGFSL